MRAIAWDVFLIKKDEHSTYQKCIDTVFFDKDCNAQYVYTSLVNHDGYDSNIVVRNDALHQEIHSGYCFGDIEEYVYQNELSLQEVLSMYMHPIENEVF